MSYLVDTSVWVQFLRHTGSAADETLAGIIHDDPQQVVGCPPVRMELSLDPNDLRRRRVLTVYDGLDDTGAQTVDFEVAADIFRATRSTGHTPRTLIDCLIAAIALRVDATVVHDDIDFDRIAATVTTLSVLRLAAL